MDRVNEKNNFNYIFFFSKLNATTILDYETESFINDILVSINTVNEYSKKINYSIILDESPNAFINQNNKLFISTGLLKYVESYEALVGVFAHEIGHLQNFHIAKRIDSSERLNTINTLTNLTVIAGSLITNNSEYLLQSLISKNVGINNFYQSFSRDQEREADYYAVETLEKLKLSSYPTLKLLNLLEKKSIQSGLNKEYHKFSSHPLFEERYNIIDEAKISKNTLHDKEINKKYNYIKAKLFGFTEKNINNVDKHLDNDFAIYAKSIILSKQGKLKKSLYLINSLIEKKENYVFLLETKGDILYSNGFLLEAGLFYKKSFKLNNSNLYISKRIFNIKFLTENIENIDISKNIFYNYVFLLEVFKNDKNLRQKLKILSSKGEIKEWIYYFAIEEKFYNKELNFNEAKIIMNKIKSDSSDNILIKIINNFLIKNAKK